MDEYIHDRPWPEGSIGWYKSLWSKLDDVGQEIVRLFALLHSKNRLCELNLAIMEKWDDKSLD